jgi:hypothetical protein
LKLFYKFVFGMKTFLKIGSLLTFLCIQIVGYRASAADYAVVGVSTAYLRAAADYESALETQELMGTVVRVIDKDRYWCKVESPQPYTAWCTDRVLVPMDSAAVAVYMAAPKYICTAWVTSILNAPSKQAQVLSDMVLFNQVRVVLKPNGKPMIKRGFAAVLMPDGTQAWVDRKDVATQAENERSFKATTQGKREAMLRFSKQFLGIPYLWGGMSPKGFDCSGLVRTIYQHQGVILPRNASQMARLGREVKPEEMQPGDLMFFGVGDKVTHVAMYLGTGRFIHSSHKVRVNSISPSAEDVYENMHKLLFCRNLLD